MVSEDLRSWLAKVDSIGELRRIEGVNWDLEVTCFADPAIIINKGLTNSQKGATLKQ